MACIFHPDNMEKWNDWGFSEHQETKEFIDDDWGCSEHQETKDFINEEIYKLNKNKIDWFTFSQKPNILTYDYKKIKTNMKKSGIAEELMAYIFHPDNMKKWNDWGFSDHLETNNFIDE